MSFESFPKAQKSFQSYCLGFDAFSNITRNGTITQYAASVLDFPVFLIEHM